MRGGVGEVVTERELLEQTGAGSLEDAFLALIEQRLGAT